MPPTPDPPQGAGAASAAPLPPSVQRTPEVALRGITVTFGPVAALQSVDLELTPGARHAVVGENGAGKSTLMKVLFGQLTPDAGEVLFDGQKQRLASPADAIARGVGMVHQHFELIAPFTVAENVILGAETGGTLLDLRTAREAVARLAEEVGLPIDPNARVRDLSVAAQQRVEILKALYRQARVLILDEPTAVLAPGEARDLWAATARLSAAGTTVVFITHKLDEVMAHADAVTVLRRGVRVFSSAVSETNPAQLAEQMVGSEAATDSSQLHTAGSLSDIGEMGVTNAPVDRPVALRCTHLTVRGGRGETAVDDVTLEFREGEIVGLAGVDGSGQVELIEALVGLRRIASGAIQLTGQDITAFSVAARRTAGIGYVPEDRHHRALVLTFRCEENAILGRHRDQKFAGAAGMIKGGEMEAFLGSCIRAFDVRGARVGLPVKSLSGGNQQKLVMARELSRAPKVLIASQPTRGLDFAASAFVHDALRRERDRGAAVLLQSLDLAEVLALADRVAVMLRGRIVAVLPRLEATEARVGALMTGATAGSA